MSVASSDGRKDLDCPTTVTLLDLVAALSDAGASDAEVVTAVLDLVDTGRVHLVGQIVDGDLQRVA